MLRLRSLLLVAFCHCLGAGALAEPLPKDECEKLKSEQADLTTAGVKDQLGRGAAWGKANLSADQLKRVERYIAVEELLAFRCGLAQLRASLPEAEEGGEQELDDKGQPVPPKDKASAPAAPAKPKAKAAKPVAKVPAAAGKNGPDGAPAKAKPAPAKGKPNAKPKVDDAYRPPAPKVCLRLLPRRRRRSDRARLADARCLV
jgi:hypothetical protein